MSGFWMGVAATVVVGLLVFLFGGGGLLLYLIGRIPWIHRVDGGIPAGSTLVAVSCRGKGRILAKRPGKRVRKGKRVQRCRIERVIAVPNRKIRVGCCGRYTPGQAEFFARTIGGDPRCGGGIKHVFMSRLSELLVRIRSYRALKRGMTLEGFVRGRQNGQILWSPIYVGAPSDIAEFLSFPAERLVPARLQPAA